MAGLGVESELPMPSTLALFGDAADVVHRANRKNYRLLEQCVAEGRHVDVSAKGYLGLAVATVVGFVAVSLVLVGLLIWGVIAGLGALVG